jgi:3-keto-5-aminohexanoate cleavage enzyme
MSEIKKYLLGDYRETFKYSNELARHGLTKMPPLIITCAITGGIHGAEANPALPETPEEQAQAAYEAYNAGASMVHIHRRNPDNLSIMSQKAEEYLEVNRMVREKCPDLIINNTCLGARIINEKEGTISAPFAPSIGAKPEVASVDIACTSIRAPVKARKAPLTGRDEDGVVNFDLYMSMQNCEDITMLLNENEIKPEWECFDIGNIKYLNEMIRRGHVKDPYWAQVLFGGTGIFPSVESMKLVTEMMPPNGNLSVIGIGACQTAMLTMAIIMGHHVRVGLEDNVFYAPHELATSNAQLVERMVRIAKEVGRPIATPAQAREMMGLGEPRMY